MRNKTPPIPGFPYVGDWLYSFAPAHAQRLGLQTGIQTTETGLKKQEPRLDVGMLKLACSVYLPHPGQYQ